MANYKLYYDIKILKKLPSELHLQTNAYPMGEAFFLVTVSTIWNGHIPDVNPKNCCFFVSLIL